MRIAIQAADLDHPRIDGTRVYISNVLKFLGNLGAEDEFLIYHKSEFNPALKPADFSNYTIQALDAPIFWTQTRFASELRKAKPDALWMPMHNIPLLRPAKTKTTVTIHDLAFKYFPSHFTFIDLIKINLLTWLAIKNADQIIAVSESTKKDIVKFYGVSEDKIRVIHHGFDGLLFGQLDDEEGKGTLEKYGLKKNNYLIYVGAIQPRKNLVALIESFEHIKEEYPELKLVLAGEVAWKASAVVDRANSSLHAEDILMLGRIPFEEMNALYAQSSLFIFPSLYEGFGIPLLEAMAAGAPVLSADNSSLMEVGGGAAHYFNADLEGDLAQKIRELLSDESWRKSMIQKGREHVKKFSWEKCAKETLEYIKD